MYLGLQSISQFLAKYRHVFASLVLLSMIYGLFSHANSGLIFILTLIALFFPETKCYLKSLFSSGFGIIVLCFILIITLHALFPENSWRESLVEYKRWMMYLEICILGLFFVEAKWRNRTISILISLSLILAIFLFLQNTVSINFISKVNNILNKNIWSESQPMFFVFAATVAYVRLIQAFRKKNHLRLFAYFLLLFIMLFSILVNGERIGILAVFLIFFYIGFSFFRIRGLLISFLLILSISLFIQGVLINKDNKANLKKKAYNLQQNLRVSGYNHDSAIGLRIDGLYFAFANFKQKPLWGYGLGTFTTYYPTLPEGAYVHLKYQGSIETYYVSLILQLGLIGFIVFLLLMRGYWKLTTHLEEYEKLEWQTLLLVIFIGCLTFPFLFSHSGRTIFLLAMAPLIGNYFHNRKNQENEFNFKKLSQFFTSSNYRKKHIRKLTYALLAYDAKPTVNRSTINTMVFQGTGRIGDSLALLPAVIGAKTIVKNVIVICTFYNVDIFKTIDGINLYRLKNEKNVIALFFIALMIRYKFGRPDADIITCSINGNSCAMLTRFLKANFNFSFGRTEIPFVKSADVNAITTATTTVANNSKFMSQIGFNDISAKYQFHLKENIMQDIENYLAKFKITEYVALNLTGYDQYRKFNEQTAVAVIQSIQSISERSLPIILLYMPNNRELVRNIAARCQQVFFHEHMPNIYYSVAFIRKAKLLISPDTAAIHFASAFNTPTLGFYTAPLAAWRPDAKLVEIVYFKNDINSIDLNNFCSQYRLLLKRIATHQ